MQAERQCDELKHKNSESALTIKSEIRRFEEEKARDFRWLVGTYVKLQAEASLKVWSVGKD
jgi:hypothetical protein